MLVGARGKEAAEEGDVVINPHQTSFASLTLPRAFALEELNMGQGNITLPGMLCIPRESQSFVKNFGEGKPWKSLIWGKVTQPLSVGYALEELSINSFKPITKRGEYY